MKSPNEMRMKVLGKAAEDADFRAKLLRDPKAAISQELGVIIPASMSIKVHQENDATAHLVIPPGSKLNEGDLRAVAGGVGGDYDPDKPPKDRAGDTQVW